MSTYIVSLEKLTLLLNHINSLGMIINIQPVTNIFAIAIDRKLLACKSIVDCKRNQLLRELVRAIVI